MGEVTQGAQAALVQSFNVKLRDELFNGEILDPLSEAQALVER